MLSKLAEALQKLHKCVQNHATRNLKLHCLHVTLPMIWRGITLWGRGPGSGGCCREGYSCRCRNLAQAVRSCAILPQ